MKAITMVNKFEIREPVWNGGQRCVGLKRENVGDKNEIVITYTRKDGTRTYPHPLYVDGDIVRHYPAKPLKKYPSVLLHWVPISELRVSQKPITDVFAELEELERKYDERS